MATVTREQLHQQIDALPEDVVQLLADFASFVMARRRIAPIFTDWENEEWEAFALDQFFREDDPVEYALEDAKEIYHS